MAKFPTGNPELAESQRNPFDIEDETQPAADGELPASFWNYSSVDKNNYNPLFQSLHPRDGKVNGNAVKPVLMESGLSNDDLAKIWRLADWDGDGYMDLDEFSVAMHLITAVQRGAYLPEKLPSTLMPSRKV
jgi:EH domain-containing protein 3/EH domain-containing protein 1